VSDAVLELDGVTKVYGEQPPVGRTLRDLRPGVALLSRRRGDCGRLADLNI
jgi:hypothetical protein